MTAEAVGLSLFPVFFFFGGKGTCSGPKRLAEVVQGDVAHVERNGAAHALPVDYDRDRASFDSLAKGQSASASEPGVDEPLQHGVRWARAGPEGLSVAGPLPSARSYYSSGVTARLRLAALTGPMNLRQIFPSREIRTDWGTPNTGP